LPIKNLQNEVPGTKLVFPYTAGLVASIVSVQPTWAGQISLHNGFVGLYVGDRAKISFDPLAVAFRVDMLCKAQPTATIIESDGTLYLPITLVKDPLLGTRSIAYVAAVMAALILDHPNREGMLLTLLWCGDGDVVAATSIKSISSQNQLAGMIYARTAGWRARPENIVQLEEAQFEVALRMWAEKIERKPIIPTENDLRHPMVQAIWESCQQAADAAISSKKKPSEPTDELVEASFTGNELGLGPFVDLSTQRSFRPGSRRAAGAQ
jgi:hypothetical protein